MIFETNTDDFGRMGLGLNKSFKGMFNGDFFKKQNLLSDSDISAIQAYNAEINRGVTSQIAFYRTMRNASVEARNMAASANGMVVNLEQIPKVSKAGQVALKGLAMAGNMIAMWAISEVISLVAKGIDNLANSVDNCKERVNNLMSSYQSALDTANSNASRVEELISDYEKLSKGVNNLGENVSLTQEEYEKYNSLTNEIADMFPELIQGYTDQGTAILNLKGNVEGLRDAYKEAQTEAYNTLIVDKSNDIVKQWEDIRDPGFFAGLFDLGASDVGGEISVSDALKQLKEISKLTAEEYRNIENIVATGSHEEIKGLTDIQKEIAYGSYIGKALGIDGNVSDKDFANAKKQAKALIKTYNAEIKSALSDVETLANAYLMTNDDYSKLDKQSKTAASLIVNNLTEDIANGFSSKEDVGVYVDNIVSQLKNNPDLSNAMTELLTTDLSSLSVDGAESTIDKYINTIAKILNEDPVELKVRLGFDDYNDDDIAPLKTKVQGFLKDEFDDKVGELSLDDLQVASKLEIPEGTLLSWDELKQKIEETKNATSNKTETDYSSAIDDIDSALTSVTNAQDAFSAALEEQAQQGTLSESTIANLRDNYDGLEDVLERTANGIVINTDKLSKLNAEEQKSVGEDLASTRKNLAEQFNSNSLAIAGYKLQLENSTFAEGENADTIKTKLDLAKLDQKQTKEQIEQLDLLGLKYDNVTSKTNAYLKALSSTNIGAEYDSIYSSLDQIKEEYKNHDYGTDEFQTFVDTMTYKDMSGSTPQQYADMYNNAMENAKKFFTENNQGLNNFIGKMKEFNMATKDANGNWKLNITSVDDLAKKIGISTDATQVLLDKLKSKGWEIKYTVNDDDIVDVDKELTKLEKKKKQLEKKAKMNLDKKELDETNEKLKAVKKAISNIKGKIKIQNNTDNAKKQILDLQKKIQNLKDINFNGMFDGMIESFEKAQENIAKENNLDLDTVLKVDDKKANEKIDKTKENANKGATLEVEAKTQNAVNEINKIFNKTYYLNVKVRKQTEVVKSIVKNAKGDDSGDSKANGTVTGKAYAYGKRGKIANAHKSKALVGELGAEMRVRDGKYEILGQNGAEFTDVKPDDIIFNAKQTKEILKNGKTNIRGNAYSSGSVSATGGGSDLPIISKKNTKKKAKTKTKTKTKDKTKDTSKSLEKFKETIDWCAKTITKLTSKIENINGKIALTENSLKSQIKYYKQLISKQSTLVKGYSKTTSVYKKEYQKSLKGLSKSDKNKIKDGTYKIEQFSGKSKSGTSSKAEKRYNKIEEAIEARDAYLSSQTDLVNAKAQLNEYVETLASIRWEKATEKVEKLNNKLSIFETRMSNVSGYVAKNKVVNKQLSIQKDILETKQDAYDKTQKDANAYYKKISAKNKKNKNSDGTIKTTGVKDKKQLSYIKTYNAYLKQQKTNLVELTQAQEDYYNAVINAKQTAAENIKTDYDNRISLVDAKRQELESKASLAEANGQVVSGSYYKLIANNSNQKLEKLNAEKDKLEAQMQGVRKYSDLWYTLQANIISVDQSIADETKNAVDNINKQAEALKNLADAKNDYLNSTYDTLDWINSFADEDDYYDDDGNYTDKGYAVMHNKLAQIEIKKQESENYEKAISDLDKLYYSKDSKLSEAEWLKQRNELDKSYQQTRTDIYNQEKELADIRNKQLDKQSDKLKDIIDLKKKSLDADKSEYDYQKSVAEKTKNIADLQKQLAMLEGNNSEDAMAERQKLQKELSDAKDDLKDTQYDKYIDRLEDAFSDLEDRFDKLIEEMKKEDVSTTTENIKTDVEDNNSSRAESGNKEILGENGLQVFDKTANSLITAGTNIETKVDDVNTKLDKIVEAVIKDSKEDVGNGNGTVKTTTDLDKVLGKYDAKNKSQDTKGKSSITKYLASQGYKTKSHEGMLDLVNGILNSDYVSGMNGDDRTALSKITTKDQLDGNKDKNATANKDLITKSLKYVKANEFISKNAIVGKKKRDEYSKANRHIYDKTGGKILSEKNLKKLAGILNVSYDSKKIYDALKACGYSQGGIVGKAIRVNGDDGIATLKTGEAVLTPAQTDALVALRKNLVPLNNFMSAIKTNVPNIQRATTATTTIGDVSFEFNLPNVVDSETLIKTIQTDTRVQKTLQNATVGQLNGSSKFKVNRL